MIRWRSFRFQLLTAVNTAIALLLGIFLLVDYRTEIGQQVAAKHQALHEEVETLLPAILQMRHAGRDAVQAYIDGVCGRMRDTVSPGHHIAVGLGEEVLQAMIHDRDSPEIFAAMRAAANSPTHQAGFGDERMVAASSRQADVAVYASEFVTHIRRAAQRRVFHRLFRGVLLFLATAVVINVTFSRLASKPLRQLVETVRKIERGELGTRAGPFRTDELRYLSEAVNSMSVSLAEVERRRREEMARARHIQEQLLPEKVEVSGLRFAHLYRPADDVAGDYYDILPLRDGSWLACIADVTGHGVAAALSATMLKAFLQEATEQLCEPREILRFVNHRLAVLCRTENFASMAVVRCDLASHTLQYASAGHESGLLLAADGQLTELPSTGILLGILDEPDWGTQTLAFGPADRLLLATDGVTEAMDARQQMFGRQRLADQWQAARKRSIDEAIDRIARALDVHTANGPSNDDVTLLALEISSSTSSRTEPADIPPAV